MQQGQTVFSDYLRLLAGGAEPDEASFERMWKALRRALANGLRKRGMWELSPRLLGVIGDQRWVEGWQATGTTGALDELTADAYAFVFIDRLEPLLAQLAVKPQVEGLVRLNVKHFLHHRQSRCDPLGTRLYKVLHAALTDLLSGDPPRLRSDSERLRTLSVLRFRGAGPAELIAAEVLAEAVAGWIDALLPELVTTTGKGFARLRARVGERISGLEACGIGAFRFRDLIDPLRRDLRARWATLPTGGADPSGEDTLLPIAAEPRPDRAYAARRRFTDLADCVERRIRAFGREDPTRSQLEALWSALVDAALVDTARADTAQEGPDRPVAHAAMPSQRELARHLAISRDRLSTLYKMVKNLVRACRDEEEPHVSEGSNMPQEPENGSPASFDRLKLQLRQRSAKKAASVLDARQHREREGGPAPRPGDIYALAEGPDCEWVVLGPAPGDPSRVLAAPADTLPATGPGDLAIAADNPAGPLSVRCRLARALPGELFATGAPSRQLGEDALRQALAKAETPRDALPADLPDPDLEAWLARLETAIEPLLDQPAGPTSEPVPHRLPLRRGRRAQALWALAAAGAGVALGVGLSRLVTADRPEQPSLEPPVQTLSLRDTPRGTDRVRFPAGAPAVRIALRMPDDLPCETVALALLDAGGRVRWQADNVRVPIIGELYLRLPRDFLPAGAAGLRIETVCGGERVLLVERPLEVIVE